MAFVVDMLLRGLLGDTQQRPDFGILPALAGRGVHAAFQVANKFFRLRHFLI